MPKIILFILIIISQTAVAQPRFAELRRQGDSLMHARRYADAIHAYEQAEAIGARKIFMTQLYTDLARCYDAAGRYSDEMRCYEQLAILVPDPELMEVKTAEIQLRTGQYQEVATRLQRLKPDKRYDDQRLIMLASALHRLGQNGQATAIIDSIIDTRKALKDNVYRAAINNKAFILSSLSDHRKAIPLLQEAVGLYPSDDPMRAAVLGNLALAEAHTGDTTALQHIEQAAKTIADTYGTNSHDYIIILRKKAEILQMLGMTDMAAEAFKRFFEHEKQYVTANFAFMTEQQRRNYWKREQPLIAECYALENQDPDFLLDVAVFSKAILYQQNIDHRHSDEFGKTFQADGQKVRNALKADECAVEFITYVKNGTERYGAIVAYNDRPTRFVPLIERDSLLACPISSRSGTKPLSYCISYTDRMMKNALYEDEHLYDILWKPVIGDKGHINKVYFAPDADLHILALEYLPSKSPQPSFYRLSSTYKLVEKSGPANNNNKVLVVGGVDYAANNLPAATNYQPDRSGSRQLSEDHILPRETSGFKYLRGSKTEADSILALLPGIEKRKLVGDQATEMEMKASWPDANIIHISTHGFCSETLEPKPAEEDKDSLREDKSLIRCGIIMAGANKYAQQKAENQPFEDGILTAREISQIDLKGVNLAVLSACQTALGKTSENGMAGMPQGLKKAGVNTIVASLWHVDDTATTMLMTRFYSHLNDADQPCTQDAMRRAQQDLRQISLTTTSERYAFNPSTLGRRKVKTTKQTNFDAPFFWAPFIVIDGI